MTFTSRGVLYYAFKDSHFNKNPGKQLLNLPSHLDICLSFISAVTVPKTKTSLEDDTSPWVALDGTCQTSKTLAV